MKRISIKVTDHAALRYLERVKGLDLDALKSEIAQVVHTAEAYEGVSGVRVDGMRYVIDQGTVITVTHLNRAEIRTAGRLKDHP